VYEKELKDKWRWESDKIPVFPEWVVQECDGRKGGLDIEIGRMEI
jgi:hypothetical protein